MIKKYTIHYLDRQNYPRYFRTYAKSKDHARANLIYKNIYYNKICKIV
jgi:hypothetical protein